MTWFDWGLVFVGVAMVGCTLAVYGCCVMAGRADDRLNGRDK